MEALKELINTKNYPSFYATADGLITGTPDEKKEKIKTIAEMIGDNMYLQYSSKMLRDRLNKK